MYKIEVSDETAGAIFNDMLIQDYRRLRQEIKSLEERLLDLEPFEFEDLCNDREYEAAMKMMLTYYLPQDRYQELFDETTDHQ